MPPSCASKLMAIPEDASRDEHPRILIVDDLPANLGVLLEVLGEAGYVVLVADSGEGALARMERVRPDLVLLDVNMPGLDGYDTCRLLKADSRWREVPVLFLTAQGDPLDKVRGFEVGAVDYITKPLHPQEVLARVRAHLQIRALQQVLKEKNLLLETAMSKRLEAEAQLQQSLDRAVLVVDDAGAMVFCTRLARQLLKRYFPDHREVDTLPGSLMNWLTQGSTVCAWQVEQERSWLEVRLFVHGQTGTHLVLLLEEKLARVNSPARLLQLGLTAREAEVLYWVAHGKTNQDVAEILNTSIHTVKKHMANLMVKTGAENRLVAGLQAAELLELSAVEPSESSSKNLCG